MISELSAQKNRKHVKITASTPKEQWEIWALEHNFLAQCPKLLENNSRIVIMISDDVMTT